MNHDVLSAGLNISGFSLRLPESKPWDVQSNQKRTVSFIVVYAYYCNKRLREGQMLVRIHLYFPTIHLLYIYVLATGLIYLA
jgi:hypothetical protein